MIGIVTSAIKAAELYLTIKSKKTHYDTYYDACKREEEIQSELIKASRSPNPSQPLIDLYSARLREQASIRETAREELRRSVEPSGE